MSRIAVVCLSLVFASNAAAQETPGVELIGPNGERHLVTVAALAALPQREVSATAHAVTGTFGGVALGEVLALVGAPRGDSLRGRSLAAYVLIEGRDGYRVTFAPAELDAGFTDRLVLLATSRDGRPLSDEEGPFRLIVPDEKRPARWIRQVIRIRVVPLGIAHP